MTPRGTQRAISLSRNYSNKRWLYNKTTVDPFSPEASKVEIKRGKNLRKITRREDKARL